MIGKILLATKGKPCTCPTGKICTACKNKKGVRVKPRITIEGSNALPVPIKITTYKETTPTTVQLLRKKHWNPYQKPAPTESANRGTKICQWYKRRKALNELKRLAKLERKRLEALRLEKARREREAEFLEQLKQREKEIRHVEHELEKVPRRKETFKLSRSKSCVKEEKFDLKQLEKARREREAEFLEQLKQREKEIRHVEHELEKVPRRKETFELSRSRSCVREEKLELKKDKKKRKNKKIKATEAKPAAESRYVTVKTQKQRPKDSFNERFVNFCYRICCQFYCCVTFILIIGFIIIFAF